MCSSWTMLAATGLTAGYVIGQLIVATVVAIVVGVLTALVATRLLKAGQKALADSVSRLAGTVHDQQQEIGRLFGEVSRIREARSQCELRAASRFATHAGVAQIISENTVQWREVAKGLDKIHSRVTNVAERTAALEGATAAQGEGLS
ncbi:MAG TPA: hypothetical protein VMY35_07360 [Phycisphaerae bacterium]|nr:hypothetical protein [Phycisphaerae bacterium]